MKKNNMLSILSLIISIVSLIIIIIWDGSTINSNILGCVVCIIFAIVSIVLGFVGRKQIKKSNEKGKGVVLVGILIGFIDIIMAGYSLFLFLPMTDINYNDTSLCSMDNYVTDCVDNGNGISTCKYNKKIEISCSTDKLKDSQFKK